MELSCQIYSKPETANKRCSDARACVWVDQHRIDTRINLFNRSSMDIALFAIWSTNWRVLSKAHRIRNLLEERWTLSSLCVVDVDVRRLGSLQLRHARYYKVIKLIIDWTAQCIQVVLRYVVEPRLRVTCMWIGLYQLTKLWCSANKNKQKAVAHVCDIWSTKSP